MLLDSKSKIHPRNLLDHQIRNGLMKTKYRLIYQWGLPKQKTSALLLFVEAICQKTKLISKN
jgi:hypothetical protein